MDPVLITIITTSIVTITAAVVAGAVTIINAIGNLRKSQADNAIMQSVKLDSIATTAATIQGHVNSSATAANAKIESLELKVASLIAQLAERKMDAALLAQSTAAEKK